MKSTIAARTPPGRIGGTKKMQGWGDKPKRDRNKQDVEMNFVHLIYVIPRRNKMAWNPSPKVAVARDFGKKFGFDQVLIIGIDNTHDKMETITYGSTKASCVQTAEYGNVIHDALMAHIVDNL